jgi:hypothetical protein
VAVELQVLQFSAVAQVVQAVVHLTILEAVHLSQEARRLRVKEKQAVQVKPTLQAMEQQAEAAVQL